MLLGGIMIAEALLGIGKLVQAYGHVLALSGEASVQF